MMATQVMLIPIVQLAHFLQTGQFQLILIPELQNTGMLLEQVPEQLMLLTGQTMH